MRTIVQLSQAQLAQLLECAPRREQLADTYHQRLARPTDPPDHLALAKIASERPESL